MINLIKISLLLFAILCFNSCSHYYYAPDEANVLKLGEKNDLKISISGNTNNGNYELRHSNIQLGYSPIKHLGLFASRFKMNGMDPIDGSEGSRSGKGHLNNVAVGGYYFLETGNFLDKLIQYDESIGIRSGFLFDVYAGYGKGHIYNKYWEGGNSELDLQKYFIQGGVHWQGKAIGLSYVTKVGRLNYFNGILNGQLDESNIRSFQNIRDIRDFPFRETTLQCYMGIKHARIYVNVSTVVTEFDNNFLHRTSLGSLGIIVEIDEVYRALKKNKD